MNVFERRVIPVALSLVLALAPLSALAQGRGRGHDDKGRKSHEQRQRNPAPPKKNGRHDNRDWNKRRSSDDVHWARRRSSENESMWRNRVGDDRFRTLSRQPSVQSMIDRRNQTKNEWRNLAIGAGALGIIGLLTKEPTLTFAGGAGALYSAYRYEQDRKSQSSLARTRAYYFSQPYFVRDGRRFNKRTVVKNGQRYYQFVRG